MGVLKDYSILIRLPLGVLGGNVGVHNWHVTYALLNLLSGNVINKRNFV